MIAPVGRKTRTRPPIAFPPEQFPNWLVQIHQWLPFYNMAIVLRDSLSHGLVTGDAHAYLVLSLWTIGSLAVTARVVKHRG